MTLHTGMLTILAEMTLSRRVLLLSRVMVQPSCLLTTRIGFLSVVKGTRKFLLNVHCYLCLLISCSVRISTKKSYTGGLFIADIFAMPHGCSVWPAYWSVGPNWPSAGEIDILEGVHNQPHNQYTLHTAPGCELSLTSKTPTGQSPTGNIFGSTCESAANSNSGCGFIDSANNSYGHDFNLIAGAVIAHLWDSNGISVWRFERNEIPSDIQARTPNPSTWKAPVAYFSASSCDISKFIFEHKLVLDITVCGDWAGSSFGQSGCPGTCADMVADPSKYKWAKWALNSIAVYQSS